MAPAVPESQSSLRHVASLGHWGASQVGSLLGEGLSFWLQIGRKCGGVTRASCWETQRRGPLGPTRGTELWLEAGVGWGSPL